MHDAYDLAQLLKLNVQIESIAAFDDNLFVGTRLGHLLTYSVNKKLGEHKHEVQLLSYNKHFSKKPIQQLGVIPTYQVLVSLSDNLVSFHNHYKFGSQAASSTLNATVLQKTRGATLFTLDITKEKSLTGAVSVLVRLCVVVKRKLLLYYWKNGEFHEMETDITVPDVPRAVLLLQDTVVLGYKSEYALYSLSKKTFEKLFLIGSTPEPIITRIDKDVFALVRDMQATILNSAGSPALRYSVKWAEHPTCVETVGVRTVEPNLFIQTMACGRANLLTRARRGLIFVANSTHVWCLHAVPSHQQIQSLLKVKLFELALKLAELCDDEDEEEQKKSVHEIQTLYAYHLFTAKQYQESMAQFLTLGTNPSDVIKLFPDLLPSSASIPSQNKFTDRELEDGLTALMDYLTEVRRVQGANNTQPGFLSVIDTTLLKCYLRTNDAMVAPLLRLNMVHFQEAERVLKKENKVSELVILYQTNGLHAQALSLLKQQQQLDKTMEYLQHLGPEHLTLLLEFAEWVIQENPQDGVKIFMEDTTEIEQLPRAQILNFILRTAKPHAISYLEHAIKGWNDTNPILHTTLANLYREKYQQLQQVAESKQEALKVREKLIQFLERSNHYTPQTVLDLFPRDDMLEERAIMLGKQGRHEQALSIYVCMLEDVPSALQYCQRVSASRAPGHDEVHILLMRILISPPENWLVGVTGSPPSTARDVATAVKILQSNPNINPSQALSVLPDDVPLKDVKGFLEESMRLRLAARREAQVIKGLVYSEHLQVQDQRMRSEARPILITEQHICVICAKRFNSQSVFALIPAGVVHYGCLKDKAHS